MIKFNQPMQYGVGEKRVAFVGRDPFPVDDAELKKGLLAVGVFEDLGDGTMRYSGKVSVPLKDGREVEVDARGYIAVSKSDLAVPSSPSFI